MKIKTKWCLNETIMERWKGYFKSMIQSSNDCWMKVKYTCTRDYMACPFTHVQLLMFLMCKIHVPTVYNAHVHVSFVENWLHKSFFCFGCIILRVLLEERYHRNYAWHTTMILYSSLSFCLRLSLRVDALHILNVNTMYMYCNGSIYKYQLSANAFLSHLSYMYRPVVWFFLEFVFSTILSYMYMYTCTLL